MKEKFLNGLKKYKLLIFLAVSTILVFFGGLCFPLWIVASALTVLFFSVCSVTEILGIVLYFLSFSGIGIHYIVVLVGALLVIAVKYGIEVAKKKNKFYVLPFVLTCFIAVVWSCVHYNIDSAGIEQGALFVALLFGIYLMFVSKDKIDVHKCFSMLIFGFITSAVFSGLSLAFSGYSVPLYYFDGVYKRMQFLSYHYNFLQMAASFAIAYYIYAFFNGKGKWWENAIAIVVSLVFGISTLSKAFILLCCVFVCYVVLMLILKYKKKSLRVVIPALVVLVVMCFVFKDLILKFVDRFTNSFEDDGILDQITTGRYSIWKEYISQITSSVPTMLFGFGLFNEFAGGIIAHNTIIHILHRVGFVGVIAIAMLVYVYAKQAKSKIKLTLSNCLPIVTYLLLSLEEQVFSDRFFLFLVFGILLTLVPKQENNENN